MIYEQLKPLLIEESITKIEQFPNIIEDINNLKIISWTKLLNDPKFNLFFDALQQTNSVEKLVVLKKDEQGFYLQHAFLYSSYPKNNRIIHRHSKQYEVNKIYSAIEATCGGSCIIGHPREDCNTEQCPYDPKDPDCCWRLATVDFSNISFELSIKDLFELQKQF